MTFALPADHKHRDDAPPGQSDRSPDNKITATNTVSVVLSPIKALCGVAGGGGGGHVDTDGVGEAGEGAGGSNDAETVLHTRSEVDVNTATQNGEMNASPVSAGDCRNLRDVNEEMVVMEEEMVVAACKKDKLPSVDEEDEEMEVVTVGKLQSKEVNTPSTSASGAVDASPSYAACCTADVPPSEQSRALYAKPQSSCTSSSINTDKTSDKDKHDAVVASELHHFGGYIASHMRHLPLERRIQLQQNILRLVFEQRFL